MPALNDYECLHCGAIRRNILIHAPADVPSCCLRKMKWLPSLGHGGIDTCSGFEHDGKQLSSIHEARRLERENERRVADDPSIAPIRFRALHQNAANMDRNTFGPPPDQTIPKARRGDRPFPVRALTPAEVARHLDD